MRSQRSPKVDGPIKRRNLLKGLFESEPPLNPSFRELALSPAEESSSSENDYQCTLVVELLNASPDILECSFLTCSLRTNKEMIAIIREGMSTARG